MDPCDRSEMVYGIDFTGFVSNPNQGMPDYSQPSLPHLNKYGNSSNLQPHDNNPNSSSLGPFPPQGMDNELYNLLINASEKEFPVDLGMSQTRRLQVDQNNNNNKGLELEKVRESASDKSRPNSRKRRLPVSTPSNQNNSNSSASTPNPSGLDDIEEGNEPEDPNESQAKRNRRLVKNREAAQLFRQRQKAYISDLEQKVDKLSTENVALQSKVDLLSAENKLIKEQLGYLRNFISQVTMTLPFPYNQQMAPRETGFARKAGFDPKYQ